ncbi:MAG: hypothetical protein KAI80_01715, partial [Hyphomicrobiaceae bacterium]|nr:hypothetical protein [Hyphomicrobiaceae bacterium]
MGWKTPKLLNRNAMCGARAILMTLQGVHSPSPESAPHRGARQTSSSLSQRRLRHQTVLDHQLPSLLGR